MFEAEVLALPLDKYDLVLGIQWLKELGDIVWNFKTLQMEFYTRAKEVTLQGNQVPSYAVATVFEGKLIKILSKTSQIAMIQCLSLRVDCVDVKVNSMKE